MAKVKVFDIEWDRLIDVVWGDEEPHTDTGAELPSAIDELDIDISAESFNEEEYFDEAVGDAICDWLSDTYGFCVESVTWDYL